MVFEIPLLLELRFWWEIDCYPLFLEPLDSIYLMPVYRAMSNMSWYRFKNFNKFKPSAPQSDLLYEFSLHKKELAVKFSSHEKFKK